jgi:hypothetical protein
MHSRNQNGWGRLFDGDDLEESERTDPNMEIPRGFADASEEKTRVERSKGKRKLTLPAPGEDSQSKRPSAPSEPERPRPSLTIEEPSFSSAELVEKLDSSEKARPAEHSLFTKEVVITAVVGLVLLAGAIAYTVKGGSEEAPAPSDRPDAPPVLPVPAPPPVAPPPVAPPADPEPEAVSTPAAVPILTILSEPSGASIEIDGAPFGKTPMIERVPNGPTSLTIRLTKDGYKPYDTAVTKNEAGHYNVKAKLEPK